MRGGDDAQSVARRSRRKVAERMSPSGRLHPVVARRAHHLASAYAARYGSGMTHTPRTPIHSIRITTEVRAAV